MNYEDTVKTKAEEFVKGFWKVPQYNNEIVSTSTARKLAIKSITEILKVLKSATVKRVGNPGFDAKIKYYEDVREYIHKMKTVNLITKYKK